MAKKLEKLLYDVKYTAGSYADSGLSMYLSVLEKGYGIKDAIFNINPKDTDKKSWDEVKEYTPGYKLREKLRDSLDTEPGIKYLQSNLVATIPFFFSGLPAAELAQAGLDKYFPDANPIVGYVTNSIATLGSQMITGYTVFMANEVRNNREKYIDENGNLSKRKILQGLGKTVKAFLSFDATYSVVKIAGQSLFLHQGRDPWEASAMIDGIAFPAWWTLTIPLGLHNGVIETRQTKEWETDKETSSIIHPIQTQ